MEGSSGKKESFNLVAQIPNFLNKRIKYQQEDIIIKDLINVIYKLFYKNKGCPITTEDIVKELFDQNKKAEKFGPKVMNVHLYHGYRNSENLVSRIKINERRHLFYPLALVLMTESDTYDFTSTSNPLYKDSITLASELSSNFAANFDEISEKVTLNIFEPSINLKDFLESYDKEYHKDILEILIELAEPVKTKYVYSPKKYGSISDLEKDVSSKLKERGLINPFPLPDYPERLKLFVTENRANELRKVLTYLEKHRILLISGVGGVGKSTLARALVDYRSKTVPRPFWFNFNQNQDTKLNDILEKLASYLNTPDIVAFKGEKREPGKTDVDKLISELQRRKEIWLIFDDLSTVLEDQQFIDKGIELLFSSLRYNTHNAKIIMTSRILPILKNGESLLDVVEEEEKQHLNGLKPIFAVNYLAKNGLAEVELDKLEELAKGVDGHPLALKLLVELVKEFGAADILEDLNIYQEKNEDTIKKARRLFDKLVGDEKGLLERISVYREPVSIKGLKEMFTENTSKDAVKKLIDKSLLENNHKGSYWLHPLIQEFSYKDLKNKKEIHEFAYNYYSSLPLPENSSKKEDLQPSIEAIHHACKAEQYDLAADIIRISNLHYLLNLWGNHRILTEIYEKLLPKDHFKDKPILKNTQVHGNILGNLGVAHHRLGELEKAIEYYEQALKISKEIGSKQGEGEWLGNLGNAYCDLEESRTATDYYTQALRINKETGEKRGEGANLGNLGNIYSNLGDPIKAIEYYEQALEISRKIGDRQGEGNRLGNLGIVYHKQGDPKKAIEYYEQALKIDKEIGYRQGEGNRLGNLGIAYHKLGDPRKAIEYYEQALKISREIGDRQGEAVDLGNLGNSYSYLREPKKAIEYYKQALKISREIGDRRGEGAHLGNLGNAFNDLDEPKKAIEYYEQALKISREIRDKRGEGNRLGNLGNVYSQLGEHRKAIEFLKQSLAIGKAIEDPKIINFCENKLKEIKEA